MNHDTQRIILLEHDLKIVNGYWIVTRLLQPRLFETEPIPLKVESVIQTDKTENENSSDDVITTFPIDHSEEV